MPFTHRERRILRTACTGCRNEAYNRPHAVACGKPVVSEKCKLLQAVKYDRQAGHFRCPYWVPELTQSAASSVTT